MFSLFSTRCLRDCERVRGLVSSVIVAPCKMAVSRQKTVYTKPLAPQTVSATEKGRRCRPFFSRVTRHRCFNSLYLLTIVAWSTKVLMTLLRDIGSVELSRISACRRKMSANSLFMLIDAC